MRRRPEDMWSAEVRRHFADAAILPQRLQRPVAPSLERPPQRSVSVFEGGRMLALALTDPGCGPGQVVDAMQKDHVRCERERSKSVH